MRNRVEMVPTLLIVYNISFWVLFLHVFWYTESSGNGSDIVNRSQYCFVGTFITFILVYETVLNRFRHCQSFPISLSGHSFYIYFAIRNNVRKVPKLSIAPNIAL